MRKAWLLLLLAPSALIYACGGDDSGTDGGTDAANDNTTKPDTGGGDAANDTGTGTETGSDAGNDVSVSLTCLKPADCFDGGGDAAFPPDSGEVCCGTVQTSGTFPQCSFNSASTVCKAPGACPTTVDLQACGTDQVRLCEADNECTENGGQPTNTFNKCCSTQYQDAGRVHFCANTTLATISGGAITCP